MALYPRRKIFQIISIGDEKSAVWYMPEKYILTCSAPWFLQTADKCPVHRGQTCQMTSLFRRKVFLLGVGWDWVHLAHRPLIIPAPDDRLCVWSTRWNENWQGKLMYSEKPAPMSPCPPQIPHDLTWYWTWAATRSTVRSKSGNPLDNVGLKSCFYVVTAHIHLDIKKWWQRKSRKLLIDVLSHFKIKPYIQKNYTNIFHCTNINNSCHLKL
jgi:hypothetical protein